MPHSSGGGSHSGGSHHSSSSHSSHRSSSSRSHSGSSSYSSHRSPSISRSYYAGARRYRYTSFGRDKYFYSSSDPKKEFNPARLLILLLYIPFFLIFGGLFVSQVRNIKPKVVDKMIISDDIGVINNKDELEQTFNEFYKKTGIQPSIVTVYYEQWQDNSSDLESYAYDRYVREFDDEMHWLIVYSEPKYSDSSDWTWEGMQGDDTDSVLTYSVTSRFTDKLHEKLEKSDRVGEAINDSLQDIMPTLKKVSMLSNLGSLIPTSLPLLFIIFHAYFMTGLNTLKYRRAVPADTESTDFSYTPAGYGSSSSGYGSSSRYGSSTGYGSSSGYSTDYRSAEKTDTSGELICEYCGATYHYGDKRCPICKTRIDRM